MKIFKFSYGWRALAVGTLLIVIGVYGTAAIGETTGRYPLFLLALAVPGLLVWVIGLRNRLKGESYEQAIRRRW